MNTTNLTIIVPSRLIGERIDFAISQMLPDLSRSKITQIIKNKQASVNQSYFKAKDIVIGGEVINLTMTAQKTTNWQASNIQLNIVFEDDDIIVVNKPAGLITHPGNGNPVGTLANALIHYHPNIQMIDRVGIVHRLDKDTSGLLVVAKTTKAQKSLIEQLSSRMVKREYNAIVYGHMIAGGTINSPIGRDGKNRVKQAICDNGREAITHYRTINKFANFTLIKVMLETGRTHQIRVHMTSAGYPLVGDKMYGGGLRFPKRASDTLKDALKHFTRQALHAKKLSFIHPTSNEEVSFKADLPKDMQDFLSILTIENETS